MTLFGETPNGSNHSIDGMEMTNAQRLIRSISYIVLKASAAVKDGSRRGLFAALVLLTLIGVAGAQLPTNAPPSTSSSAGASSAPAPPPTTSAPAVSAPQPPAPANPGPSPGSAPSGGTAAGNPQGPDYGQTFLTAVVNELPKMATVLLAAALVWWVTARLTARWDIRKKRQEFDLVLVKEFYELIGTFKSVAREAHALGARPQPSGAVPLQAWEQQQAALARRALEAEMKMEAILLKLITEGPSDDRMSAAEWQRQRHAAGLLRAAFRNLRETVEAGTMRVPEFDSPDLWLFNRLAGEVSKIVYARSARSPRKPESAAPALDAYDYLRLVVYRTGDLQSAVACISPKIAAFSQKRHQARQKARRVRVRSAFKERTYAFVSRLAAAPQQPDPVQPGTRVAVELANELVTDITAARAGTELFAAHPDLEFYLVLADRPPRVIAFQRGGGVANYTPTERLPDALPWSDVCQLPVIGNALLAWDLDRTAEDALREIAAVPLKP